MLLPATIVLHKPTGPLANTPLPPFPVIVQLTTCPVRPYCTRVTPPPWLPLTVVLRSSMSE